MKFQNYTQYGDALIYVVLTAVSFIFIDRLGNYINPFVSLFYMAVGATLWCLCVNLTKITHLLKLCVKDKNYWLLSGAIAINWICSIHGPHRSDPFVYLSLYFIAMAICGFIANYRETKSRYNLFSCGILVITILFISTAYTMGANRSLWMGTTLGIGGGVSVYVYAAVSRKFSIYHNLTSSQVLAVRFIPLCLGLFIAIQSSHLSLTLSHHDMEALVIMAIISLIIPIYFYQQAIFKLGASRSSLVVAYTPMLVFVLFSLSEHSMLINNLIISIAVLIALVLPKLLQKGKKL